MTKNNKKSLIVELKEKLGCSEEECLVINSIVEDASLFGKKNKQKMVDGFMNELDVSEDRASEIYDVFMHIFRSRIKWKLIHPFRSYKKK